MKRKLGLRGLVAALAFMAVPIQGQAAHNVCHAPLSQLAAYVDTGTVFVGVRVLRIELPYAVQSVCVVAPGLNARIDVKFNVFDVPGVRPFPSGCLVDIGALPGCQVTGFTFVTGPDASPTYAIVISGFPAGNGTYPVDIPYNCLVGIGTTC